MGELVITQSVLSQLAAPLEGRDAEELRSALGQLERHMRNLQESVMRVRMLPISVVFNRFPRLVRDLGQRLGKKIELRLTGESTELDKTVLEKIGDPLVHLVRNSIDHGIETPEVRIAAGKPAHGIIELNAYHKGGNVVVEVSDDGGGLKRDTDPRQGARARPGGSGRGAVRGPHLQSHFRAGILHRRRGQRRVGPRRRHGRRQAQHQRARRPRADPFDAGQGQHGAHPPAADPGHPRRPAGARRQRSLRGAHRLDRRDHPGAPGTGQLDRGPRARCSVCATTIYPSCGCTSCSASSREHTDLLDGLLMIVEADGKRVGLFVDELMSQQQVVIKSLETNFRPVVGLAGRHHAGRRPRRADPRRARCHYPFPVAVATARSGAARRPREAVCCLLSSWSDANEVLESQSGVSGSASVSRVLLVISLVIGGIALTRLAHLDEVVNRLSTQDWETARAAMENQIRTRDNVGKSLRILLADGDAEIITRIRAEMEENSKANSEGMKLLEKLVTDKEGLAVLAEAATARDAYNARRGEVLTLAKDPKTRDAAMKAYNDEVMPLLETYLAQFRTLKEPDAGELPGARPTESRATYESARRTIIAAGIAALVFGIALAILLARSIVRPLRHAVQRGRCRQAGPTRQCHRRGRQRRDRPVAELALRNAERAACA